MKNRLITIGLSVLFLGTMTSVAFAETVPTVQPNNGFLEQPKAIFMDAPPVPVSDDPTFLEQVRAANLLIHKTDTLPIGSPEYQHAHRRLVSNLRMLERQMYFNPVDLARFNSHTHPARFITDRSPHSSDVAINALNTFVDTSVVLAYHTHAGVVLTRRSIIAAADLQNSLRIH